MKPIAALFVLPLLLQIVPVSPQAPRQFATLEGRVIHVITGEPLPGVVVTSRMPQAGGTAPAVADRGQADSFDRPVVQVLSDAEGRFSVRVVAGRATVVFGKDLYGVRTLTYTLMPGQQLQNAVIRLMPTGTISGRVVDSRSIPVPSARIRPFQYRYTARGREIVYLPNATTNDRGEFRLPNLQPGTYWLSLSTQYSAVLYPGVREINDAEELSVDPGRETRLKDVVLLTGSTQKGTIEVRLINGPGEGAKDVVYNFTEATPNYGAPALDGNSIFEVPGERANAPVIHLEPSSTHTATEEVSRLGTYAATVTWTLPGGITARSTASTAFSGGTAVLDLIVRTPEVRLSCQVMLEEDDRRVTPLSRVNLAIAGASQATCGTGPDGTGAFRPLAEGRYHLTLFQGIPADTYVVRATLGGQDALNGDFEVTKSSSSLEVRVRRNAGVIRGSVADRQSRRVHDAFVAAIPDSPAPQSLYPYSFDRTDQDGVFEIRGLRPGSYRLYSWSVLDEGALLNPSFLKAFEGRGTEIRVHEGATISHELRILDEEQ